MNKKSVNDPFAEREAQNYENPIPSREFILTFIEKNKSVTRTKMAKAFDLTELERRRALAFRLQAMVRDGQLRLNRQGHYCLATKKPELMEGRIVAHRDGHGLLIPEHEAEHLIVPPREMRRLFDGDHVRACFVDLDKQNRPIASVVEILSRKQLIGRLHLEDQSALVILENKKKEISIASENLNGARDGDVVTIQPLPQLNLRSSLSGYVVEIIGQHMTPGMEIQIALRSYELPHVWSDTLLKSIQDVPQTVRDTDRVGRTDLCHLPFVTIDDADAKDYDDAVCCLPLEKGFRLYVAIADVSHYVAPDSMLDQEARRRGTSVYFPQEVIPMLPEALSNGICSLMPKVERLAFVCDISIDFEGKVTQTRFYEALIYSHACLTYEQVSKRETLPSDLVIPIDHLYALYDILLKARRARGAIEFETQEPRFTFDEHRKIESIQAGKRNDAHRLIEECMLLANVVAAKFVNSKKIPTLYRVHDKPDPEKISTLKTFLSSFGLQLDGGKKVSPKAYFKLLNAIKGREDAHLIQTVLLRSMNLAVYQSDNIGHFGLAYSKYAHFTSPIRRYPDLLLHRALKCGLQNNPKQPYTEEQMADLGAHCSMTERRADEATRDVVNWLKCEYMRKQLGEVFSGIISGVTGFGFFVQIDDIFIDGLVHITSLKNDYYQFDATHHILRGECSGQRYRLGDSVCVLVTRVDLDQRRIDFEMSDASNLKPPKKEERARRP